MDDMEGRQREATQRLDDLDREATKASEDAADAKRTADRAEKNTGMIFKRQDKGGKGRRP